MKWNVPQAAPTRLKVTFKQIVIKKADPKGNDSAASPWNLYFDLNGYWKLVNDWSSKLLSVKSGQKVPLNRTVKISVPAGRGVSLLMQGRECDEPGGQMVLGNLVPTLKPCPPVAEKPIQFSNDDVGIVLDNYKSPAAALGKHTRLATASTKGFPGSGKITFGDGKIGQHVFQVTYVVKPG